MVLQLPRQRLQHIHAAGKLPAAKVPYPPAQFYRWVLHDLQEALLEERKRLEAAVQKEMKGKGHVDSSAASAGMEPADAAADAQEDALDAFMSDVQHQIEDDKVLHHTPAHTRLSFG